MKRKMILKHAPVVMILFIAVTGCRTPADPAGPLPQEAQTVEVVSIVGRIQRVNPELGYAMIKCTSLPSIGEEVRVYREDELIGRLHVTGPIRMPFALADIVEGVPEAGDQVKATRTRSVDPTDGGVP